MDRGRWYRCIILDRSNVRVVFCDGEEGRGHGYSCGVKPESDEIPIHPSKGAVMGFPDILLEIGCRAIPSGWNETASSLTEVSYLVCRMKLFNSWLGFNCYHSRILNLYSLFDFQMEKSNHVWGYCAKRGLML